MPGSLYSTRIAANKDVSSLAAAAGVRGAKHGLSLSLSLSQLFLVFFSIILAKKIYPQKKT
jgi:hypothetical protein